MITYVINTSENQIYDSNNLFENSMIALAGYNKIRWMTCLLNEIDTCTKEIFEQQSRLGVESYRIAVLVDFYGFDRIRTPYGHGQNGYGGRDDGVDFSLYLPYIESYLETHLLSPLKYAEAEPEDFSVYYVQNSKFDVLSHIDNGMQQVRDHLILWESNGRSDAYKPVEDDLIDDPTDAYDRNAERDGTGKQYKTLLEELREALAGLMESLLNASSPRKEKSTVTGDVLQRFTEALRMDSLRPDSVRYPVEIEYDNEVTEFSGLCSSFESRIRRHNADCRRLVRDCEDLKAAEAAVRGDIDEAAVDSSENTEETADRVRAALRKEIKEKKEEIEQRRSELAASKRELAEMRVGLEERFSALLLKKRSDVDRYDTFDLYCTPSVTLTFHMRDYPSTGGMRFGEFHAMLEDLSSRNIGIHRHFYPAFTTGGSSRAAFDTLSLSMYLIWLYGREESIAEGEVMEVYKIQPDMLREVLVEAWNKISCAQKMVKDYTPEYFSLDIPTEVPTVESESDMQIRAAGQMQEFDKADAYDLYRQIEAYTSHSMGDARSEELYKIFGEYLSERDRMKSRSVDAQFDRDREEAQLEKTTQYPSRMQMEMIVNRKEQEISEMLNQALDMEYVQVDYTEEKEAAEDAWQRFRKARLSIRFDLLWDTVLMLFAVAVLCGSYALLQAAGISSAPWIWVGLAAPVFIVLFLLSYFLRMLPHVRAMRKARHDLRMCLKACMVKHEESISRLKARYMEFLPKIEATRYTIRNIRSLYAINQTVNNRLKHHNKTLNKIENSLSAVLSNLGVEPRLNTEVDLNGELDLTQDVSAPVNSIYRVLSLEVIEKLLFPNGRKEV